MIFEIVVSSMNKLLKIALVLVVLIALIISAGCMGNNSSKNSEPIVGTWIEENALETVYDMYEFSDDGVCIYTMVSSGGTYDFTYPWEKLGVRHYSIDTAPGRYEFIVDSSGDKMTEERYYNNGKHATGTFVRIK